MSLDNLPKKIQTTNQKSIEEIELLHKFYSYEIKEKKVKVVINRPGFIDLALQLNFYRFGSSNETNAFVRLVNGRVTVATEEDIQYAIEDYIEQLPDRPVEKKIQEGETISVEHYTITPELIRNSFINNIEKLTARKNLSFLRNKNEFKFLEDAEKDKYIFFNNNIVHINERGISNLSYSEIDKLVWESSIIDFDFTYTEQKGEFEQFFEDITGADDNRKNSLMSVIGYLLHNFYDYDLRAIFLTDVNLDFDTRAGGTGKGIIGKALMQMLNRNKQNDTTYVSIPGTDFNGDKDNRYSRADVNTQLIHIEDAKKTFNMENMVNDITEGVNVRKMYRDPFSKNMKILVSTNFSIDFNSATLKRRGFVFELTNYFSDKFRPSEKYKWFFGKDWNTDDWNQFYSFMVRCCYTFICKGLIFSNEQNYSNRVLMQSTDPDFVDWFYNQIEPYKAEEMEHTFIKENLFQSFVDKYPDALIAYKKPRPKFTEWCQTYCRLKAVRYCEIRSTLDEFVIYPSAQKLNKSKEQKNKVQTV